jgi:hypothetical protein
MEQDFAKSGYLKPKKKYRSLINFLYFLTTQWKPPFLFPPHNLLLKTSKITCFTNVSFFNFSFWQNLANGKALGLPPPPPLA